MKQEIVIQLLDAAKTMTGSDYATAKIAKVGNQTVYHWRTGRAKMPVADVVLVAKAAGLDPVDWGSRAIVSQYEGTEKGAALSDALKKALEVTGEDTDTYGTDGELKSYLIRCILC